MRLKKFHNYFLICILCFCILSCNDNSIDKHTPHKKPNYKKEIIKKNQGLANVENYQIEQYIKRHKWEMKTVQDGLRYMIYHHGNGMKAKENMQATISYKVSLINGEILYTSAKDGPAHLIIGKDPTIARGVQEGLQYMHVGDKAKFIVPSHLAFGVLGDNNKIPSRSTVIYDITLLKLSN